MPSYEFEIVNEDTGKPIGVLDVVLPVSQRDKLRLRRVTVPRSVSISGAATVLSPGQQVLRGFYKEECKHGSRFDPEFSPKQIKEAWKND